MKLYQHWLYLRYVVIHKWFVMVECFKRGLFWRGLMHDMSKFRPSEWFPYVYNFYGRPTSYKEVDCAFDLAWLLHQRRNDHHWQFWLLAYDDGGDRRIRMSPDAVVEMVCDWIGAGRAQGHGNDVHNWYEQNKNKMQLHPHVRAYVETLLKEIGK